MEGFCAHAPVVSKVSSANKIVFLIGWKIKDDGRKYFKMAFPGVAMMAQVGRRQACCSISNL
jgi:hypothetical protein